jgi:tetratricopeptide (TPR) repeat protein
VAGIILSFLFQVIFYFVTVSPEEKKMIALQSQADVLKNQNQELINGKNELLRANVQLKESIDKYQIENTNLKNQVELLRKRTENIDTLSKDETRIGDLVLHRKGSTLNIDSVDNVVLGRINDAKTVAKDGDIDKAISIIEETEQLHPKHIPEGAKILKATYLCNKADYTHALRVLKEIDEKRISPENAQVYFNLIGYCYGVLDDYESAAKYLRLAVEKNTNSRITNEAKKNLRIIERKLGKQ